MSSRMEKYSSSGVKSRTNKNERLYDQVGDITINYDFIDVDNAVELTPNANNKSSREDYQKQRELNKILPHPDNSRKIVNEDITPKEDRIYDINEILKVAKSEDKSASDNSKRLINTEYNILTKLDIKDLDKENYRKEDLRSLIDDIYKKEEPKKMKNFKRKSEKELLEDLMADNDEDATDLKDELTLKEELSKDILEKNKDEEGTVPITEEIKDLTNNEDSKPNDEEIPESYHKEENEEEMFLFDDLKDKKNKKERKKDKKSKEKRKLEELEATIKEESLKEDGIDYDNIDKDGKGLLIAIIVVVILIILTVLFFLYEYFFGI